MDPPEEDIYATETPEEETSWEEFVPDPATSDDPQLSWVELISDRFELEADWVPESGSEDLSILFPSTNKLSKSLDLSASFDSPTVRVSRLSCLCCQEVLSRGFTTEPSARKVTGVGS